MAENTQSQQKKGCTGDCMACSVIQRGYCSSQLAYNNMQLIGALVEKVNTLTEKVNSMQGDTELVAPMQKEKAEALV